MRFALTVWCVALLCVAGCAPKQEPVSVSQPTDAQLIAALAGRVWVAESIHGRPVVDASHTAMVFTTNGRVNGRGGCNAYSGGYILKDGTISFSPLASTMKMCVKALADQEMRFFQSLAEPQRVSFENGLLHLTPVQGEPSVFAAQEME